MSSNLFSSRSPKLKGLSLKLLGAILDTVPTGIRFLKTIRNKQNKIIDFKYVVENAVAKTYTGNKKPAKTLLTREPGQEHIFHRMEEVVRSGFPMQWVHSVETDGNIRWFNVRYAKCGDGIMLSEEDITESRLAEDKWKISRESLEKKINELSRSVLLKEHQVKSLISELDIFNTILHDYKDTLRNVYTGLEFIAWHDAANLGDTGKANVRRSQSAIQKLKLITEDIITYFSIHTPDTHMSDVNLCDLLHSLKKALDTRLSEENISLDYETLPTVQGYPFLLNLLFYHLLTNAIKFRRTDTQPVIHIAAQQKANTTKDDPQELIGTPYLIITITDNGIGFSQQDAETIFLPLHRLHDKARHKGTGIGLAICRKIMSIHNGFIKAKGEPLKGATFYCYFPLKTV